LILPRQVTVLQLADCCTVTQSSASCTTLVCGHGAGMLHSQQAHAIGRWIL